jgi:hypothetical protein
VIVIFTALFLLPPQFTHRHQADTGDQSHHSPQQRRGSGGNFAAFCIVYQRFFRAWCWVFDIG